MAITSSFANLATVSRASKKTDAGGWDFTNGGTVGTLTEYASGVAALHPSAGLLAEESSTNEIRNARCEGATEGVIGSGGSLPTYFQSSGGTREVIGTGTERDWPYVDLKLTGSANVTIYPESSGVITASSGEDWTASVGLAVVAGSTANVTSVAFGLNQIGAANGFPQSSISGLLDGNHRRFFYHKNTDASTTSVRPVLVVYASGAIDITLRIYAPQCENLTYPTSPIFPEVSSPAAATRAADDISLAAGSWLGTAHTIYVKYAPCVITKGSDGTLIELSDGSGNNRISLRHDNSTGYPEGIVLNGGSFVAAPIGSTTLAVGVETRLALAVAQDDVAFSVTGETQATDSSTGSLFTPSELQVGASYNGGTAAAGYIRDLRYWPRRLSNAELEALVGN